MINSSYARGHSDSLPVIATKVVACGSALVLGISSLSLAGHLLPFASLAFISFDLTTVLFLTSLIGLQGAAVSGVVHYLSESKKTSMKKERALPTIKQEISKLKIATSVESALAYDRQYMFIKSKLDSNPIKFGAPHEHHAFHYVLTILTDKIINNNLDLKSEWAILLEDLQEHYFVKYSNFQKKLDCTFELNRLKGNKIEITIEELINPTDLEIATVYGLMLEAFEFEYSQDEFILKNYLYCDGQRCFVARDMQSNGILGVVLVRATNQKLFIHSLARKPEAAKVNMTAKLEKFFLSIFNSYSSAECEVFKNNPIAKGIYEKLGFKAKETSAEKQTTIMQRYHNRER